MPESFPTCGTFAQLHGSVISSDMLLQIALSAEPRRAVGAGKVLAGNLTQRFMALERVQVHKP